MPDGIYFALHLPEIISKAVIRSPATGSSYRTICPQLTILLRQTEERQTEESSGPACPPEADWFFVVDCAPTTTTGRCTLMDGSVVLSLSASPADAQAMADLDGIDIRRHGQMSEADRSVLRRCLARHERGDG